MCNEDDEVAEAAWTACSKLDIDDGLEGSRFGFGAEDRVWSCRLA